MPLQNRVTPEGDIVAVAAHGTIMGSRGGCFHRCDRTLGRRRWASRRWICCELVFKGRHRQVMAPHRYTELFFLDEATALAAGHRPCFECRRAEAKTFSRLWPLNGPTMRPGRIAAGEMDGALHRERLLADGGKRTTPGMLGALPEGTMVRLPTGPALVHGGRLRPWSPVGYGVPVDWRVGAAVAVLTPPSIVAILAAGYRPRLHMTVGS